MHEIKPCYNSPPRQVHVREKNCYHPSSGRKTGGESEARKRGGGVNEVVRGERKKEQIDQGQDNRFTCRAHSRVSALFSTLTAKARRQEKKSGDSKKLSILPFLSHL